MSGGGLLPSRPLGKASRTAHPSEPAAPRPAAPSTRTGPGRVRKSLYLPEEVAAALDTAATAIYHDSRGAVSKADAMGALIRYGLDHEAEARTALGVTA